MATARIAKLKYYYGKISREDAELILKQHHTPRIGLYLLRDYSEIPGNYVISLVCNRQYEYDKLLIGLFWIELPGCKFFNVFLLE